jgi:exodeoxyribonuclease X
MNISDAIFSVVDVETTGLDPKVDEVVEMAMVNVTTERGLRGTWSSLFQPSIPIPPAASAIHHLTDEDVRGMPYFKTFGIEPGNAFAAHNAAFDSQFIPQIAGSPMVCTMRLAKKLWPMLDSYSNQFLRYHLGLQIPDEYKAMGMHRALPDAVVSGCLLIEELKELAKLHSEIGTVEQLVEWLAEPILLYRCTFGKHGPKDGKPGTPWSEVPKDYLRWMLGNMTDMDADLRFTAEHYAGVRR